VQLRRFHGRTLAQANDTPEHADKAFAVFYTGGTEEFSREEGEYLHSVFSALLFCACVLCSVCV
jgi:hypothetical protein